MFDTSQLSVSNDKSIVAKAMGMDQSQRKCWSQSVNLRPMSFVWYTTIRYSISRQERQAMKKDNLMIDNTMINTTWYVSKMYEPEMTFDIAWQIIQEHKYVEHSSRRCILLNAKGPDSIKSIMNNEKSSKEKSQSVASYRDNCEIVTALIMWCNSHTKM